MLADNYRKSYSEIIRPKMGISVFFKLLLRHLQESPLPSSVFLLRLRWVTFLSTWVVWLSWSIDFIIIIIIRAPGRCCASKRRRHLLLPSFVLWLAVNWVTTACAGAGGRRGRGRKWSADGGGREGVDALNESTYWSAIDPIIGSTSIQISIDAFQLHWTNFLSINRLISRQWGVVVSTSHLATA